MKYFWIKVINIACHILNQTLIRSILKNPPYKLYKGKKSNISYFKVFGYYYFILINNKDKLKKIDVKSDKIIFLGYSSSSKAYKVFNRKILIVEESIYVV